MEEKENENQHFKDANSKNLISALFLIAFSLFVIISSLRMRVYNTFYDAPGIFPFVISSVICLCSIFLLIDSIKNNGIQETKILWKFKEKLINNNILKRIIVIIGLIIIYGFILVQHMHFTIATFIFLSVIMVFLKIKPLILILVSFSISLGISFVFGTLFNISLP